MPMSVVPPSPPCAITRTFGAALHFHRRRNARRHRRGVAEQRVHPGDLPGGLRIGVENTSRHPVAFAAIRLPSAARMAASTA